MPMTSANSLIAHAEIFPWNDNFATGIEAIDSQHHKLVDLLNKLASHMAFGSDEATLYAVFDELADYTVYHFQTEEGIWQKFLGDDALALAHQHSHAAFMTKVVSVRGEVDALHNEEAIDELVTFLTHWLAFHILEDDTYLANIVHGLQRGQSLPAAKETASAQMKGAARVLIEAVLSMYDSLSSRTLALLREVNQRRRTEVKLRLASNIIESSADGIFITNLQGLITDVNPAYCKQVQRSREELLGQPVAAVMPSLFESESGQQVWAKASQAGHWAGELSNRKPGGDFESVWLTLSTVKDASQHTLHFVGMLSSISQLVERHHAMEAAANQDALTGLPNRRLLKDRLAQAMERSKRDGTLLAVCYLDLDQFKPVNDNLGHAVGDKVLCAVAQRMAQALRGADTVARVGGDEFVLLLGDLAQPEEAQQLLERLLQIVLEPIEIDHHQLQVGASMGATVYPIDAGDAGDLLQHADQMLYLAKAQGRACLRMYTGV